MTGVFTVTWSKILKLMPSESCMSRKMRSACSCISHLTDSFIDPSLAATVIEGSIAVSIFSSFSAARLSSSIISAFISISVYQWQPGNVMVILNGE